MGKFGAGLVFLLVVLSVAGTTRGVPHKPPRKPSALFAFGDSYADTGNQNHAASSWHYPYGITWPGYPTGRFGNGHIQTDFLAEVIGLPEPTPYADISNGTKITETGVNFALGGSGVTFALGVLPLHTQIDNFELVLRTGAFSPQFLAESVTLVSNVGNDYSVNYTAQEFVPVIEEVVEGVTLALKRMYDLGLRNILVANLPPINCIPRSTQPLNYTSCVTSTAPLIDFHNNLLLQSVEKLNTLPNANFLILNELDAFSYVLNQTKQYGITELLTPCCNPINASTNCGSTDALGNPLYTLCNDPTKYVYWDSVHPVESTWKYVVELFYYNPGFVIGARTLKTWLHAISFKTPAPAPGTVVPVAGAVGELETFYNALITDPDYAESIGLLQAVNFDEYLAGLPAQIITVFLPINYAYYTIPVTTIDLIYGTDQVQPVAEFHVVKGYYNSTELSTSAHNLTTVSGFTLQVTPILQQILVGPQQAIVVNPDLYKVEGQLVVHGISKILLPPGLPQ
ncbi:unnamed protein product [Calypogeia fissa]